jgi:hypothetical protein
MKHLKHMAMNSIGKESDMRRNNALDFYLSEEIWK